MQTDRRSGRRTLLAHFSQRTPMPLHRPNLILAAVLALSVLLAVAASSARAAQPFEVLEFSSHVLDESGSDYTLAGGHPFAATTSFSLPSQDGITPVGQTKDAFTNLPPGLIGTAGAFPRCTNTQLRQFACPPSSAIGSVKLNENGVIQPSVTLYNMRPERGFPAEFAFVFALNPVFLYPQIRPRTEGYGVTVIAPGAIEINVTGVTATFFGLPSVQDATGGPEIPFLSNPVDCSNAHPVTTIAADSWEEPGPYLPTGINPQGTPDLSSPIWATASFPSPPVTGCDEPALTSQFKPTIETAPVQGPGALQADQPSGLHVALDFPQSNDPTDPHSVFDPLLPQAPELKNVTVSLPPGLSISPSSAAGLGACSDQSSDPSGDQVHYDTNNPVACPDASKLGTVTTTSPLLPSHDPETDAVTGAEPIHGDVYLLKPHAGDLPLGGGGDGTFRILIDVVSVENGINVKLPGTVTADRATGQMTATFLENPQLPVDHLELNLKPGARAPLSTPVTCGTFTTTTDMVPWSTPGTPDATPSSSFNITAGPNGSSCVSTPQQRPFSPALVAGNESTGAGAFSPFTVHLTRSDGEQELKAVALTMPKGFTAKLTGIPYCSDAAIAAAATRTGAEEAASPSCPAASLLGTLMTGAGPGSNPYYVPGRVYLAGPYNGGSLSLVFITPAVAGPFDLGNVVIRAAVHIDPETAQVTVNTDRIPQLLDGIPLQIRRIDARIDRPGFILNPTDCTPSSINGTVAGGAGGEALANVSSVFQAAGCSKLKFAPKFSASIGGHASKLNGVSLTTKVIYPFGGEGGTNLTRVKVELPKQLPSRLTTLQQACPAAQFAKDPAGCPAGSVVGHATVHTPVLPVPLTGPAIFVSHGGEAFPSLEIVLQGYGVKVILVGATFISQAGVTSTTFNAIADNPVTSFELTLPQGKFSALGTNKSLCAPTKTVTVKKRVKVKVKGKTKTVTRKTTKTEPEPLIMPTHFIGQNGATYSQETVVSVTGCAKAKPAKKAKAKKKAKGKGKRKK